MSYSNVVGGKLKLKGKPLDVRAGAMKKKKKKSSDSPQQEQQLRLLASAGREGDEPIPDSAVINSPTAEPGFPGENNYREPAMELEGDEEFEGGRERQLQQQQPAGPVEDHRTPAEKKYHEQKAKLEAQRLSKVASKSHRQRVEEFNQYLANLSEHYDIPKVGPG